MDDFTPEILSKYIPSLLTITKKSAQIAMSYYKNENLKVSTKSDRSPVTEADQAIDEQILKSLLELFKFQVISEEGKQHLDLSSSDDPYWLVDPIDGTKEFIAETDEFTINIALIYKKQPIIGVICLPVFNVTYYASLGNGSHKIDVDGSIKSIKGRTLNENKITLLVSRRSKNKYIEQITSKYKNIETEKVGSSYKFCKIADGLADLYVRKGPIHTWDTAAGHCIINEAGGKVVKASGGTLIYDPNSLVHPPFWVQGDKNSDLKIF